MTRIVEVGPVVASVPYIGSWRACVRREGQTFGELVGPVFATNNEAWDYAISVKEKEEKKCRASDK